MAYFGDVKHRAAVANEHRLKSKPAGISGVSWFLMGLSLVFWVIGLIPIINFFSGTLYWLIWLFIMAVKKASLLGKPKTLVTALIGFLLGFIPFIGSTGSTIATWIILKSDKNG